MKTCRICGDLKPLDEFGVAKSNADGRDSRCKRCRQSAYRSRRAEILDAVKKRYWSDPDLARKRRAESYSRCKGEVSKRRKIRRLESDDVRAGERNRYASARAACFRALGGACRCGVSDQDVLCVDHVSDDGQQERRSGVSPVSIWRKIARGVELYRYQLMCFNCNLRKSVLRDRLGPDLGVMKRCFTCRSDLDLSFFKSDKKYPDGKYYECRKCTRNRILTLKVAAVLALGQAECSLCGCRDIICLTLDHVNDDGSQTRLSDGLGEPLYRRIVSGKIDRSRFQVLCLNCNLKKHKDKTGARESLAGFSVERRSALPPPHPAISSVPSIASPTEICNFSFDEASISIEDDHASVSAFFEKHHYAGYGRYGSFCVVCRVRGRIAAAAKFASPIRQEVASSLGLEYSKLLELDRFCIDPSFQKKNFASFFLAAASKCLHASVPSVTHLVSFADPEQGHSGTIYLAANWKEVRGRGKRDYRYEDSDGNRVHKKTVWDRAKVRGLSESEYALASGLRKISVPAKKKFVIELV